jgi:molybdenum cofactor cytidylyltransferase
MTAILILAAGGSRRLGQPKQLVTWRGMPLIRHTAETALASGLGPVVVVLGAAAPACREALAGLELTLIENTAWADGMGGSIACGMRALPEADAVIITLCDMPFLTAEVFQQLERAGRENASGRVATCHGDAAGPPAWFSRDWFPALTKLAGHTGARSLFQDGEALERIDFPEAAVDLDTPADLAQLRQGTADEHSGSVADMEELPLQNTPSNRRR